MLRGWRLFFFQQTPETFHVTESLLYPLSGAGGQTFVQIEKRDLSTPDLKRILSGAIGVPLKNIHHAGMKDRAATAVQWLSWPTAFQKAAIPRHPQFKVLQTRRHDNPLRLGHVARNHFRLMVQTDDPWTLEKRLASRCPNYYGPQRFGRADTDPTVAAARLAKVGRQKDAVSVIQSVFFNAWLRDRLAATGEAALVDDYWTATNGKRCFQAEMDDALAARYECDEIVPTGPMFGYKVRLRDEEAAWLAQYGLKPQDFRQCGKAAMGARRPIFLRAGNPKVTPLEGDRVQVEFDLPSGAYATVLLTHLAQPDRLSRPAAEQPNYLDGFGVT